MHLLVAFLLVLVAVRAALAPSVLGAPPVAVTTVAAALGALYAGGAARLSDREQPRATAVWLGALTAVWWALVVLTPDGVWLAFPLFFLQLHLLAPRTGLLAVALTTVAAVAGYAWHRGALVPAAAIGPVIGAAVAVAVVLGYHALARESEQRRLLVEELTSTRAELAAAERAAGAAGERERLAREIHDTLAQGLSSIQLLLRAAGRALPDQPSVAAGHVEQARSTAQENLAEARRFVRELTPPALATASLPAALQRLCDAVGAREGLAATLHLSGEPAPVPTPYEVALLRVAQSALANTAQHAGARRVDLTLTSMAGRVSLDVVDDGAGFDPGQVPEAGSGDSGFGLAALRARVGQLGGELAVESAPGAGTAIAVTFPLDDGAGRGGSGRGGDGGLGPGDRVRGDGAPRVGHA